MAAMVQSGVFRRLVQIALCFLFISISLVKPDDEQKYVLDAEMFAKAVKDKAHFIMFFAPWCGHCKRLQPTWNELAEKYNNNEDSEVNLGKVDCTVETALCSEYGVTGYPTLKFFRPGEEAVKYQGKRDAETLEKFMKETLDPSTKEEPEVAATGPPEAKDGLYELNAGNFDKHVAKGSHFVKFYAPWCGHCKRLAPTWEELAKDSDGKVTINKIDCTSEKPVCDKFEVRGYPTLLFIKDGQKIEKYGGARDLDALKSYVEKMQASGKEAPKPEKVKKVEEKQEVKKDEDKPSKVVTLGEDSFETGIGTGLTFVKFFAPWCGHCKRLAPTWEELAEKVASKPNIKIAKVDCTVDKDVCKKAEVRGYPTLILYSNGKKVDDYNKARELDALYKYITERPHDEL